MGLVPYVDDDHADPAVVEALEAVRLRRGAASPLIRALANSPAALGAWDGFSAHVGSETVLDAATRELVILRVAQHVGNSYEWRRHVPKAVSLGVDEASIAGLHDWRTHHGFDASRRAALTLVDDLLDDFDVSDDTMRVVREQFGPEESVELSVALAWYVLIGVLVKALRVEDDDRDPVDGLSLPLEAVRS